MNAKMALLSGSILGFLAVALGAFGAHGLTKKLEGLSDAAKRMSWWETASFYQLTHALLLVGIGLWMHASEQSALKWSGLSALCGVLIFSGTLYAMALGAPRFLGAITPIGGLLLLAAWLGLCIAAWKFAA